MAGWKYCGLNDEKLAMYYCTDCRAVVEVKNPNRAMPTIKECPKCHAEMTWADDVFPRNCYTCSDKHNCEIEEGLDERTKRSDTVCDCWRMSYGRAIYLLRNMGEENRTKEDFPEWQKNEAIMTVLGMATINAVSKDCLLNAVRWLARKNGITSMSGARP